MSMSLSVSTIYRNMKVVETYNETETDRRAKIHYLIMKSVEHTVSVCVSQRFGKLGCVLARRLLTLNSRYV